MSRLYKPCFILFYQRRLAISLCVWKMDDILDFMEQTLGLKTFIHFLHPKSFYHDTCKIRNR